MIWQEQLTFSFLSSPNVFSKSQRKKTLMYSFICLYPFELLFAIVTFYLDISLNRNIFTSSIDIFVFFYCKTNQKQNKTKPKPTNQPTNQTNKRNSSNIYPSLHTPVKFISTTSPCAVPASARPRVRGARQCRVRTQRGGRPQR